MEKSPIKIKTPQPVKNMDTVKLSKHFQTAPIETAKPMPKTGFKTGGMATAHRKPKAI